MDNLQKDLLEKIINWTFPGLTFYYRDTALSDRQLSMYKVGQVLRNGFFIDVASTAGKPTQNTRFIIASSKAAPVYKINPNTEKWGMHVINANSYFKVLDIYEIENNRQIFLLHIPAKGIDFFWESQTNFEEQFINKARESFDKKYNSDIIEVFQDKEWIDKTRFAIGLDNNDNYFSIKPSPLQHDVLPLFEGLRKLSNDVDDTNVFVNSKNEHEKKGFWNKLFN